MKAIPLDKIIPPDKIIPLDKVTPEMVAELKSNPGKKIIVKTCRASKYVTSCYETYSIRDDDGAYHFEKRLVFRCCSATSFSSAWQPLTNELAQVFTPEEFAERQAYKEERRKSRSVSEEVRNQVKEGDIYESVWGYDQTNVDFYQVVRVTQCCAYLKPIASRCIGSEGTDDIVVPVKDAYLSTEAARYKIKGFGSEPYFTLNSFSEAHPWDGTPSHRTNSYFGH